jgi:hypothetical protein
VNSAGTVSIDSLEPVTSISLPASPRSIARIGGLYGALPLAFQLLAGGQDRVAGPQRAEALSSQSADVDMRDE